MPAREFLVQTVQAHIAALTPLQRRCPETCFYTVLMHSFQFALKSITLLYSHLNFSLVLDICHAVSHISSFMLGGRQAETQKLNFCLFLLWNTRSKALSSGWTPRTCRTRLSIPLPSHISPVKTTNFPLIQKGRNSLYFLYSSFFFLTASWDRDLTS